MKKDFISLYDCSKEDLLELFSLAGELKSRPHSFRHELDGKTLAMIFAKPSTRTRVSFEVAMTKLGGHAIYLSANDMQLGRGETLADTARVLSRYADGIVARVFGHGDIVTLAEYASVPVINGLSDFSHPCQAVADYFTILEHKGHLEGLTLAYIGDANNVTNSLVFGAAKLGVNVNVASPQGYTLNEKVLSLSKEEARSSGSRINLLKDPYEAVKNADVIYTDVWTSMGQEKEREIRLKAFQGYQIDIKLFESAKRDAIFMHCLPAHRGEEVTSEVCDHERSVIFDQAENRLHTQMAILTRLIGKTGR